MIRASIRHEMRGCAEPHCTHNSNARLPASVFLIAAKLCSLQKFNFKQRCALTQPTACEQANATKVKEKIIIANCTNASGHANNRARSPRTGLPSINNPQYPTNGHPTKISKVIGHHAKESIVQCPEKSLETASGIQVNIINRDANGLGRKESNKSRR